MKEIFKCINSKIKEGREREKEKDERYNDLLIDINKYFSKLPEFIYQVTWDEYTLYINVTKHFMSKKVEIECGYINSTITYTIRILSLEELEKLYRDREDIIREIAKQYGCI